PDWAIGRDQWGLTGQNDANSPQPNYAVVLQRTLADQAAAAKVRVDIAHEIEFRGGAGNIVVFEYPDASYIGKSLAELATIRHTAPLDLVLKLQLEGFPNRPGGARLRS